MLNLPGKSIVNVRLSSLFVTVGFLLFGFAVLVIGIDTMHMRPDEELTFRNMEHGFAESITILATRNNQAPLWWVQIWGWQRTAGMSEFAGRVNSILWSMLTLSLVYQIGRTWFQDRRYGWFSMTLLSVNAYFFIYALEIRMYALGMLAVTLSMRVFYSWLTSQKSRSAVLYGISTALLLYIHYYLGFIILAQVIYFGLFYGYRLKIIRQGIIVAITGLLAWLPGIFILINQLQFIDFAESGGLNIPTKATNTETIFELVQLATNGWWWLYGIILIAGVIVLWRKRWFWLVLAWLILSPALVFLVNTQATIYNVRYTSFLIPSIGLGAGIILAGLPLKKPLRWVNWVALGLIAGMSLYTLPDYIPTRTPLRDIFGDMSDQYQTGDVLYALPIDFDAFFVDQFERYLPADLVNARVYDLDEVADSRRVWFATWRFLSPPAQEAFQAIQETHRLWYVAEGSDCDNDYCYIAQLLVAPPSKDALFFGETLGYLGADIISPVDNGKLPVILWWEVDETPVADYSISLQLIADDGALVSQVDRQIKPPRDDAGEIPTSQMVPGGNYVDLRELAIASDLPDGDYRLQLIVYQWWDGVRLTLPDGSDIFQIETITIDR